MGWPGLKSNHPVLFLSAEKRSKELCTVPCVRFGQIIWEDQNTVFKDLQISVS